MREKEKERDKKKISRGEKIERSKGGERKCERVRERER